MSTESVKILTQRMGPNLKVGDYVIIAGPPNDAFLWKLGRVKKVPVTNLLAPYVDPVIEVELDRHPLVTVEYCRSQLQMAFG